MGIATTAGGFTLFPAGGLDGRFPGGGGGGGGPPIPGIGGGGGGGGGMILNGNAFVQLEQFVRLYVC